MENNYKTIFSIVLGDAVSCVKLKAGDDAGEVAWIVASDQLCLYASHIDFIKEVVKRKQAAWDT